MTGLTRLFALTAAAMALGLPLAVGPMGKAKAAGGVEAGILMCKSVPGTRLNLFVHSRIDLDCTFRTTAGKVEEYKGRSGIGLGLDLNWDRDEEIGFSVINGGTELAPGAHALSGTYVGGKASVTLGVGAGAAALIGGSGDSIALQPLALERSSGFGLAGGVGYLVLEAKPAMAPATTPGGPAAPIAPPAGGGSSTGG